MYSSSTKKLARPIRPWTTNQYLSPMYIVASSQSWGVMFFKELLMYGLCNVF